MRRVVSLFSGGGVGDLGIVYGGSSVQLVAACELEPARCDVIRRHFPDAHVFEGDIWTLGSDIVEHVCAQGATFMLIMSPPCQGMSTNGAGRIQSQVKRGKRCRVDERNRLILPGLQVAKQIMPEWIMIENVRGMQREVIRDDTGVDVNIIDLIRRELTGYDIQSRVIDFSRMGVAQHRERLITICRRSDTTPSQAPSYFPPLQERATTLRETIAGLPSLDGLTATRCETDPLHHVPLLSAHAHFCISHTPEGCTAYENDTCVQCKHKTTDRMRTRCAWCEARLPRPQVEYREWTCVECGNVTRMSHRKCPLGHAWTRDCGEQTVCRVSRGFKPSYRRMSWDAPAGALTTNSGVLASDVKGHPTEHRVLSLREILIVSTIAGDWPWKDRFRADAFSQRLVRTIIGESIPPAITHQFLQHMIELTCTSTEVAPC